MRAGGPGADAAPQAGLTYKKAHWRISRACYKRAGAASEPGGAPIVAVPRAGERFSDEDLDAMYGVPTAGGMRVSRKNRCIALVRPAGSRPGRENAGQGACFVHTGRNSDYDGSHGGDLSREDLALSRSKEDGYTVLCFAREGDALVFVSRVECDSHELGVGADADGRPRRVVEFKMRTVSDEASAGRQPADGTSPASAAETSEDPRVRLDSDVVEMVERAISMQDSFKSRGHLARALPRDVDAPTLDRVLDHLLRTSKIAMDGDALRWTSRAGASVGGERGGGAAAGPRPTFAGTFLEGIGDERARGETVGEYVVRLVNTDEPGAFDDEDAKEIDEGLRQMAGGECYTYEQMRKEFCS